MSIGDHNFIFFHYIRNEVLKLETVDLVTVTEEIFNAILHFMSSACINVKNVLKEIRKFNTRKGT